MNEESEEKQTMNDLLTEAIIKDFVKRQEANNPDEQKKANISFQELYKLYQEDVKENDERFKVDTELELKARELDIKEKQTEIDGKRLNFERISGYIGHGLKAVGIILGGWLTIKTLDVNLESVVSDRDAVSTAKRIFDKWSS